MRLSTTVFEQNENHIAPLGTRSMNKLLSQGCLCFWKEIRSHASNNETILTRVIVNKFCTSPREYIWICPACRAEVYWSAYMDLVVKISLVYYHRPWVSKLFPSKRICLREQIANYRPGLLLVSSNFERNSNVHINAIREPYRGCQCLTAIWSVIKRKTITPYYLPVVNKYLLTESISL